MGWSVYLLDETRGLAFEIGESWATGFPVEVLIDVAATQRELERRAPNHASQALAVHLCSMAELAGFDVRIEEGQEVPDGFKYAGGFLQMGSPCR